MLSDSLHELRSLIHYYTCLELNEPLSCDKEDYHYWQYELKQLFLEKQALETKITNLLDDQLADYFAKEVNPLRSWSKTSACQLLKDVVSCL